MSSNFLRWLGLGLMMLTTLTTLARADAPGALRQELAAIAGDPAFPLASLSVLAVRGGKIVAHEQFGHRFIDELEPARNMPANADTMYRIASISKLIVSLGVMRLVEDGKLELDADVGRYLGFRLRNPHFPRLPITLRQLLSHTSSIRDDGGYHWSASQNVDFKDVFLPGGSQHGEGAMWSREAGPGAWFQYANLPWGVVAAVMERATGERFDRLMRRLILDPMGLRGGFHPADFSARDLADTATLYRKAVEVDDRQVWNPAGPWVAQTDDYRSAAPVPRARPDYIIGSNGTLFGPMGNCRLTVEGLGQVMLMLMNDGRHEGRQILGRDSVRQMLDTQWRHDGRTGNGRGVGNGNGNGKGNGNSSGETDVDTQLEAMNAWGLGVQIFMDISGPGRGDRLVPGGGWRGAGHLGEAYGLTSAMVFDPATKSGMVFLIGGTGFDPETNPGAWSAMHRHEERILGAIHKHVFGGGAR